MSKFTDYYALLDLPATATADEIKQARRRKLACTARREISPNLRRSPGAERSRSGARFPPQTSSNGKVWSPEAITRRMQPAWRPLGHACSVRAMISS